MTRICTRHRFTLPELRGKLEQAGFNILTATYANTFLFPVVAARRFLKHLGIGRRHRRQTASRRAGLDRSDIPEHSAAEAGLVGRQIQLPSDSPLSVMAEGPLKNDRTPEITQSTS